MILYNIFCSTGGGIRARVVSKGLHLRYPDTHVRIWGKNLHAPMADRVLELPMDVYEGESSALGLFTKLSCLT